MQNMLTESLGQYFEDRLLQEIEQQGNYRFFARGTVIMDLGQVVQSMPLLLDGAIKIMREDEDGDELLLYFLETGDTCAMTLSCCLGRTKSEIRAIAEMDSRLIMIPIQKMEDWIVKYKSWRNFVFDSYHNRLMEMLETIDSLAFQKLDERLLKYLQDKCMVNHNDVIQITHLQIAQELNTSRVVVSRLLKGLEKESKIKLNRNQIQVLEF